jgi:outer membrane receptor protein involved in Fe transport
VLDAERAVARSRSIGDRADGAGIRDATAQSVALDPRVAILVNSYSFARYQNIGNPRIEGVEIEGTYDTGMWSWESPARIQAATTGPTRLPLASIPPDKISTMFGVRLFDSKLTASVRWTAVAAKKASDIPDRDNNAIPDFLPTPTTRSTSTSPMSRRPASSRASQSRTCSTNTTSRISPARPTSQAIRPVSFFPALG